MSQALRKLAGTLNKTGTVAIFTNQLREKIGVMFGNPRLHPAVRRSSSMRPYAWICGASRPSEGTQAIGNRVRAKVVKNKMAPPFRQAEFDIMYGEGVSREGNILDMGVAHGIVDKSGAYFSYGDERLGQGRNNVKAFLKENPRITDAILAEVLEAVGIAVPQNIEQMTAQAEKKPAKAEV